VHCREAEDRGNKEQAEAKCKLHAESGAMLTQQVPQTLVALCPWWALMMERTERSQVLGEVPDKLSQMLVAGERLQIGQQQHISPSRPIAAKRPSACEPAGEWRCLLEQTPHTKPECLKSCFLLLLQERVKLQVEHRIGECRACRGEKRHPQYSM
jgi:hypothetical protein